MNIYCIVVYNIVKCILVDSMTNENEYVTAL